MLFSKKIRGHMLPVVVTALGLAGFTLSTQEVSAQKVEIQIGASSGAAKRSLVANGYDQIEIYHQGFKSIKARACKDGKRFDVKLGGRGNLKSARQIGKCRSVLSGKAIERRLSKLGLERFSLDQQNAHYVAVGCLKGERVRLVLNQFGEVERRRGFGQCERIFEPSDIRPLLNKAGYNRVIFQDRQLPWYAAHACKNGQRVELLLTRFGEIKRQRKIGQCAQPLNPARIEAHLKKRGYNGIYVFDRKLPGYRAEACQNNRRFEVVLNQFGELKGRNPLGPCAVSLSKKDVTKHLNKEGFKRINIVKTGKAASYKFNVDACLNGRQHKLSLSQYGDVLNDIDRGLCRSHPVSDIKKRLEKRGVRGVSFFADGCYRGTKFRFQFDEYGDRINRKKIGKC